MKRDGNSWKEVAITACPPSQFQNRTTTACSMGSCPKSDITEDDAVWETDVWSSCSHTCGPYGFRLRQVRCMQIDSTKALTRKQVDSSLCDAKLRPLARATCNRFDCVPLYTIGEWSQVTIFSSIVMQNKLEWKIIFDNVWNMIAKCYAYDQVLSIYYKILPGK